MIVVVDASVALKWFFRLRQDEGGTGRALALLRDIGSGRCRMLQPPHFLAEMAAVLVRKTPDTAERDLADLQELGWDTRDGSDVYARAIALSARFDHHLFDTLYHATALLATDAVFITADRAYHRKAKAAERIALLDAMESSSM